jgi:hypothetical protein
VFTFPLGLSIEEFAISDHFASFCGFMRKKYWIWRSKSRATREGLILLFSRELKAMQRDTGRVLQFSEVGGAFQTSFFQPGTRNFFMRVRRLNFSMFLLTFVFLFAGMNSAQATPKKAKHKSAVPETAIEVVPAPPPPPPLRPEQLPAVAPQVSYQNGQLTIVARNSTLGDILRAVHTKTGANVELPGGAPERVVGQFGPGPSRDVVASLLNGTHFNYVMLGSAGNSERLDRLILSPKVGGDVSSPGAAQPPVQAQNQPDQVPPQPDAQPDQDANNDDFADSSDAEAVVDQTGEDQQQGQQIGQPNAKTPEQMLLELQRQQQLQQQQQQQGQNPAAGYPPVPPGTPHPQPPQ